MDKAEKVMQRIYDTINFFNKIKKLLYKNQYKNIVAIVYEWFDSIEFENESCVVCKDKYKHKRYLKKIMAKSETRIIADKEFEKGIAKIKKI